MGSPLSGLLADAVMKHFEAKAFEILQPRLWIRYVDDKFVILRASTVDPFHQMINEQVPGINFTREEKKDGQLPFLDILLMRQPDGRI
ncbi:unnamed protein product [Echinostoma caproni]|uniref:Reverse transcriptase domain-containing protein n=1 Tax=Echinostoma caproni TaxID=27848 RepID=A0A183AL44_9TREM|nr:unnamed protein product [Echinostoma caproni]